MKRITIVWVALFALCVQGVYGQEGFNCYTILAGKNATTDGSVMIGHNEDDWQEQMMSFYVVPARSFPQGSVLKMERNAPVPQAAVTPKYLWLEMIAQDYADAYLNDYGVAVVSNRCASREDREDYTDSGISYVLRRTIAENARTAKEAVEMIGRMVEQYGYSSTGRSYSVADSNEAWIVSVVQGRRWVARRIADNEVMLIPNYYVIDRVDLDDTANVKASKDIISYAIERGWYDPQRDGAFSFRKVYSDSATLHSSNNIGRKWGGLRYLSATQYALNDEFPFSFVPKQKIDLSTMMAILSDHFEGTEMDMVKRNNGKEPHDIRGTICNLGTQFSQVFQLRGNMPKEIGSLMWLSMYSPCRQVYVPWYLGTTRLPENFGGYADAEEALENHFSTKKDFRATFPDALYWKFLDYSNYIGQQYTERMNTYLPLKKALQQEMLTQQPVFEKQLTERYEQLKKAGDPQAKEKIAEMLNSYSGKYHDRMMKMSESRH